MRSWRRSLAIARAVLRLRGEERAAAAALAIAIPAFLLHALADIDWDFVAVCAPVFMLGGLVIGIGGEVRAVRMRAPFAGGGRGRGGAARGRLLAGGAVAGGEPGRRRLHGALRARSAVRGQRPRATRLRSTRSRCSRSGRWPRRTRPSLTSGGAVDQYRRATRLQPENPDTWVALGRYELCFGDVFDAYRALNQAYTLDPFGPAGIPGGPLDQARAAVEKRGTPSCRR